MPMNQYMLTLMTKYKFKVIEFSGLKCGQASLCRTEWNTLFSSFPYTMAPDMNVCFRPTLEPILNLKSKEPLLDFFPSPQIKVLFLIPTKIQKKRNEGKKLWSQSRLLRNVSIRKCASESSGRERQLQQDGKRENSPQNGGNTRK